MENKGKNQNKKWIIWNQDDRFRSINNHLYVQSKYVQETFLNISIINNKYHDILIFKSFWLHLLIVFIQKSCTMKVLFYKMKKLCFTRSLSKKDTLLSSFTPSSSNYLHFSLNSVFHNVLCLNIFWWKLSL